MTNFVFVLFLYTFAVNASAPDLHHPNHRSHFRSRFSPDQDQPTTPFADHVPATPESTNTSTTVLVPKEVEAQTMTLTPNHIKAGIAGGDAYPFMKDHIGWWYDWSPNPSKPGRPIAVPMLWGAGTVDRQDADRLTAFQHLATVPKYVLGYEEPDCPSGSGSASISVSKGASEWEALIAPLKAKGAKVGSPAMCKQADESWLSQFAKRIKTPWDFTAIHINKNSLNGVKKDIEHYKKYGKPIWVTEFACVDDHEGFRPCTNQQQINRFISEIVPYLQNHPDVYAYAYSNGLGLGNTWPLMNGNTLSESGKAYLAAIKKYA